jgi:hypothetical protein
MSIQPQAINQFLETKVKDGSCSSIEEAEKEVISQLVRRDVERAIKVGEEQIEKGQYKVLDDDFINQFVARMAKKFLPKHS